MKLEMVCIRCGAIVYVEHRELIKELEVKCERQRIAEGEPCGNIIQAAKKDSDSGTHRLTGIDNRRTGT